MWQAATILAAVLLFQAENQSNAPKPFIAFQIERSFSEADLDHRNPIVTPWMLARRSDGSEVSSFMTTEPDGRQVETREVTDIRRGMYFMMNISAKTVTTFHQTPTDLYQSVQGSQSCPAEANDPSFTRTTLLGHPVVVFRREDMPDVTEEVTAALDLDCYPLRKVQTFASGSVNETEVTSIAAGEPPDALFEVPAGYREVSPSQANAEYAQKYPGHSLYNEDYQQLLEKRYQSHRAPTSRVQ